MFNIFKQIGERFGGLDGADSNGLERIREDISPTERQGEAGFSVYSGYVQEKEKDAKLTGRQKYVTYSEILVNTAIVGAGVRYFLNLVSKASWNVTPADDSPAAEEAALHIKDSMKNMDTPWNRVIRRAAMYRFNGFGIQEWIGRIREDGLWEYEDIEPRPSHTIERWDVVNGKVLGVVQRAPQTQEEHYIPIEKTVYVVDDSLTDKPEGIGIFRHVVEAVNRLKRYEQLEGIGFETDLRGIPIARAPLAEIQQKVRNNELTAADAAKILKPVKAFVANHIKSAKLGMVLDSTTYKTDDTAARPSNQPLWDVDLLRAGNTSQEEIATAINRINHEIARLLGVENILLGSDGNGTQALSRDKSQNFFLIIDSTLNELEEAFNKDFIGPLWELNGFDPQLKPTFKTEQAQFKNVEEITTALKDVASAGAPLSPDDPVINEIRELLGLETLDLEQIMADLMLLNGETINTDSGSLSDDPMTEDE